MGPVDPKARGVENFENRSGEEFHVNSLLSSLEEIRAFQTAARGTVWCVLWLLTAFLVLSRLARCLPSLLILC